MFDQTQKALALTFARTLADRDYGRAYAMLSAGAQSQITLAELGENFESMIPLDWREVNPLELEENPLWDEMFLYVVLGGEVYSEAIIVHSFTVEDGLPKIERFEFGRP